MCFHLWFQTFDNLAGSVLNKPKPKVDPPPPSKEETPAGDATANETNGEGNSQPTGNPVEMDTD
jgi:hypothetical protein